MKKMHFTTRDDLYTFLDAHPHDDEKTDAMLEYDVQYTGASLADAGWTTADEPDGLLDMLSEPGDDGYYLTQAQARRILDDIERYTDKEVDD